MRNGSPGGDFEFSFDERPFLRRHPSASKEGRIVIANQRMSPMPQLECRVVDRSHDELRAAVTKPTASMLGLDRCLEPSLAFVDREVSEQLHYGNFVENVFSGSSASKRFTIHFITFTSVTFAPCKLCVKGPPSISSFAERLFQVFVADNQLFDIFSPSGPGPIAEVSRVFAFGSVKTSPTKTNRFGIFEACVRSGAGLRFFKRTNQAISLCTKRLLEFSRNYIILPHSSR